MCSELGPAGRPKSSSAFGSWTFGSGAPTALTISGAKIATRTSKTMKASAAIATLSRRKRRQKSCRGERAVIAALFAGEDLLDPGREPSG